jgi:hypothetical protein
MRICMVNMNSISSLSKQIQLMLILHLVKMTLSKQCSINNRKNKTPLKQLNSHTILIL